MLKNLELVMCIGGAVGSSTNTCIKLFSDLNRILNIDKMSTVRHITIMQVEQMLLSFWPKN